MSRILLVDDDVSLLKLMSMRLRSQGYEVDTADSAEGALDRLRQQRADLVLSDLRMAGMDGLALFERIQAQWLGLPVIIMGSLTPYEFLPKNNACHSTSL